MRFSDDDSWRITNGGKWYTSYPWGTSNQGANDIAFYLDRTFALGRPVYDPFRVSKNNLLTIRAQPVSRIPGVEPWQIDGYEYVSGMLSTSGQNIVGDISTSFAQRYGYYEVRAQLPKGRGIWPSFWMLDDMGLRAELDVFEFLGSDTSSIYQSVHYNNGNGGSYKLRLAFDPTTALHNYGVLVSPSVDTYYVDGVATKSVPDVSVNPFYFIVSLQVGGQDSFSGPPDATTPWPADLYLQYFHAYQPTMKSC